MINILLVDDHAIMRDGLKRIVTETTGMEVIAEAENGKIALDILSEDDLAMIKYRVRKGGAKDDRYIDRSWTWSTRWFFEG